MLRRHFVRTLAAVPALLGPRSARASDSRIEVLTPEPLGRIAPDLYGHFTEHIGGVVYDGIWVGENSKIPNTGGIRKQLTDALRKIGAPVIRWPGGCFADSYNWRDGIGPRAQRPRRTNFWVNDMKTAPDGPQKYDPNEFGTNEFVRFCRLAGAEPYLAANLRSLTPLDFDQWIEYCNAPAGLTSLSTQRGGEPFHVKFWGVGNESWGCGGDFTPEEYATEFRRFTSWMSRSGDDLKFIAAGPSSGDLDWTHRFFARLTQKGPGLLNRVYGWAMHYYCGTSGGAVEFTNDDWYTLLASAGRMEQLIESHWQAMGEIDTARRVKLVIDEWGAWHRPGTEIHPAFLFGQMPTLRDALISALTLDTFNRHADKIAMANVAQLINNLHCLFLAHEDKFVATANYPVFELYAPHQGATALRTIFSAPRASKELWGLAGSASLKEKTLVLTVVNPHVTEARTAEIAIRGAEIREARARTISAPDIHAHNTFQNPRAVEAREGEALRGGLYTFPPASITRLDLFLK
ncbi:MAG: alpha-N-arabinofuranosidase [Acidobacteriota bacterium]